MKINSNFSTNMSNSSNIGQESVIPQAPHRDAGYMSSEASMAARAYAMPQINFGKGFDKIMVELMSDKPSNKIRLSFEQARNLLARLGYTSRINGGSHAVFQKSGSPNIVIAVPHGGSNFLTRDSINIIRNQCLPLAA